MRRNDLGSFRHARRGSSDMEGSQGQLGSRLADGLSGDNSNRFADIHQTPRAVINSVAFRANAVVGFTSQHRTGSDVINA